MQENKSYYIQFVSCLWYTLVVINCNKMVMSGSAGNTGIVLKVLGLFKFSSIDQSVGVYFYRKKLSIKFPLNI